MAIHAKMRAVLGVFQHYLQFHGVAGKKPNRKQRRAASIGVKVGKNTIHTKAKKKAGSLRRVRQTLV